MRRWLLLPLFVASVLALLAAPAGAGGPTGYTLNFTSSHIGDTETLVATLNQPCDNPLRIGLFRQDNSMVTDNGNGGVPGATQIGLTNPGSLVDEPGNYIIRVTCNGIAVNGDTAFTVLPAEEEEPPVDEPPEPTEPEAAPAEVVGASPAFTG